MNWQQQFDYFDAIAAEDVEMFAPPRETARAIATYNHALQLIQRGAVEEAQPLLKIVADDYPMFPHASHLYGCVAAAQGNIPEAAKYLERVSLLATGEEQAQVLKRQFAVVKHELKLLQQQDRKVRQREELLRPVKADMAMTGILQKAPRRRRFSRRAQRGQDAESLNQESMLRTEVDLFGEEAKQERERTLRFIVLIVLIAALILSLFFLVVRPRILSSQQTGQQASENLAWLEQELQKRAADQSDIAQLLKDYQNYQLQSGSQPAGTGTAEHSNVPGATAAGPENTGGTEVTAESESALPSETAAETPAETPDGSNAAENGETAGADATEAN